MYFIIHENTRIIAYLRTNDSYFDMVELSNIALKESITLLIRLLRNVACSCEAEAITPPFDGVDTGTA